MNNVGHPTDEELNRLEEVAEELFVKESWAVAATFWDDDDVHLRAYSTIGSNVLEGYPMYVISHKQEIIYERQDEESIYRNYLEIEHPRKDRVLNQMKLEW